MTISYTKEVATSSFSCFLKLLARWRGSIYKLLWKDFIMFAAIYFILGFIYRFAMNDYQKKIFEMISRYCSANNDLIPVAFILGFYVTLIMTRWWNQLGHIPWPDHMAMYVTANVQGMDEQGRLMRRTMVRYMCLAFTLTMSCISPAVRKRFPTNDHIVKAGIMTENEKYILENKIDDKYGNFFIPLAWATSLVSRARKEGRIKDDFAVKTLIDEINDFRRNVATLMVYDWITVPLVYTQVVTLAVYMFFLACLMGRQFLNDKPDADMYFPLFTFLEYFFYMGWLKVAEALVNPFGEDEEDFDCNFLIDRNLHVAYLIVDGVHNEHPELIRDQYWDQTQFEMPYTLASEQFRIKQPHLGSAFDLTAGLSVRDKEFVMPSSMMGTIGEADSNDEDDLDSREPSSPAIHQERESASLIGVKKASKQQHSTLKRLFSRSTSTVPSQRLSLRMNQGGDENLSATPKQLEPVISPVTPTSISQLQFDYDSDNPEFAPDDEEMAIAENIPLKNLKPYPGRDEISTSPKSGNISISPGNTAVKFDKKVPQTSIVDETKPPGNNNISEEILKNLAALVPKLAPVSESEVPKLAPVSVSEVPKLAPVSESEVPKLALVSVSEVPKLAPVSESEVPKLAPVSESEVPKLAPLSTSEVPPEMLHPVPETPTSPDSASPVWVLASSQWRLSQGEVLEKKKVDSEDRV